MAPHQAHGHRPESSVELLERARAGDSDALDRLLDAICPRLRRWASGRLPRGARTCPTRRTLSGHRIQDVKTYRWIPSAAGGRAPGHLRQAIEPDQGRVAPCKTTFAARGTGRRRPEPTGVSSKRRSARKPPNDTKPHWLSCATRNAAIVARIELQCSYDEMAVMLGKPSPERGARGRSTSRDAARLEDERCSLTTTG